MLYIRKHTLHTLRVSRTYEQHETAQGCCILH